MNYDPNMTNSGRMAKQTVNLVFQQWDYTAEIEQVVGGNCTGLSVIDCAVCNAYECLDADRNTPFILMTNPGGEVLHCGDDEDRGEDWLKDMLVRAEIVSIETDA